MATDHAKWRESHVTFDVEQQKSRTDNRQLRETVRAGVSEDFGNASLQKEDTLNISNNQ